MFANADRLGRNPPSGAIHPLHRKHKFDQKFEKRRRAVAEAPAPGSRPPLSRLDQNLENAVTSSPTAPSREAAPNPGPSPQSLVPAPEALGYMM